MGSMKKLTLIARYNVKKWLTNPRVYVIFILALCYVHFMESPIGTFAENSGNPISIYIFPFFMSSLYSNIILLLLLILLFCDAPFMDAECPYIILRVGRKNWYWGQLLYIWMASAIFILMIIMFTVLVLIPNISLKEGWGKVINTFAQTGIGTQHGIVIPFDYSIILNYTPIEAMVIQFLLCWLIAGFLGKLIFLFNSFTTRAVGVIIAAGVVLFQLASEAISAKMTFFSPASWSSLAYLTRDGIGSRPSIYYAFVVLIGLNILISILSLKVISNMDIEVSKNI